MTNLTRKRRGSSTLPVNTPVTSSVHRRARKRRTSKDPNRKQDPHYVNTIKLEYQLQPEDRSGHPQEEFTLNFQMQSVPRPGTPQNCSAEASRQKAPRSDNTAVYGSSSTQWPCTADQDLSLQDEGNHFQVTSFPASNDPSQTFPLASSYPPQAPMFWTHSAPDNASWNDPPINDDSSQFNHNCGFPGALLASSNSQVLLQDDYSSQPQHYQHQQEQYRGHVHAPMREENPFGACGNHDAFFEGNPIGMSAGSPLQSEISHHSGNSYNGCSF